MCIMSFRTSDINWMDERGKTALDYAMDENKQQNIELLLTHGASECV